MVGTFGHFLVVLGIIYYVRNKEKVEEFIDDVAGMSAEQINKMNLKESVPEYIDKIKKEFQTKRGGST